MSDIPYHCVSKDLLIVCEVSRGRDSDEAETIMFNDTHVWTVLYEVCSASQIDSLSSPTSDSLITCSQGLPSLASYL